MKDFLMSNLNKFTTIVPCYNNSEYMFECLNSLVNQTYKKEMHQIIVIDDGSEENDAKVIHETVKSFNVNNITFIKNKTNLGIPYSVNIGIKHATGDYVSYHGNDDISELERLEKINKFINSQSNKYNLITSSGKRFNSENMIFYKDSYIENNVEDTNENIKNKIYFENKIIGGACFFNKKIIEKIGYFDLDLLITQDYNYWIRALKYFNVSLLKEDLYLIRNNNKSVRKRKDIVKSSSHQWLELCRKNAKNKTIIKNFDMDSNKFELIIKGI